MKISYVKDGKLFINSSVGVRGSLLANDELGIVYAENTLYGIKKMNKEDYKKKEEEKKR